MGHIPQGQEINVCGIFGFSIPLESISPAQRILLAATLGMQNDDRGGDSWGAYLINGDMRIVRGLGNMAGGLPWHEVMGDTHVLMGHTRKATVGATTIANSHPFEIGNVVGAHNGWISNHTEMNKKYDRNFDVDSMHIFAHIQKGWNTNELTGYGAIEYTNKKRSPLRINLCKFFSGELSIAGIGTPDNTIGVIWSSSERHLDKAMLVAGLDKKVFNYKISSDNVYYAEKGQLFEKNKKMELGTTTYGGHCGSEYNSRPTQGYKNWKDDKEKKSKTDDDYAVFEHEGVGVCICVTEIRTLLNKYESKTKAIILPDKTDNAESDKQPELLSAEAEEANKAIIKAISEEKMSEAKSLEPDTANEYNA
jgi:hypothetical protein